VHMVLSFGKVPLPTIVCQSDLLLLQPDGSGLSRATPFSALLIAPISSPNLTRQGGVLHCWFDHDGVGKARCRRSKYLATHFSSRDTCPTTWKLTTKTSSRYARSVHLVDVVWTSQSLTRLPFFVRLS
jgi:hypothetical protein